MRKGQEADSLEDLLRLQEQFKKQKGSPAAKVTLVGGARSQANPISGEAAEEGTAPAGAETSPAGTVEDPHQEPTGNSSDWVIVGEVSERVVEATSMPMPSQPAAGGGFPVAQHRRQSRFALSRMASSAAASTAAPPLEGGAKQADGASAAPTGGRTLQDEIDAENRAALRDMSPKEVEAARRELLEQLGPERAAKLRQRAAQKEEQAAQKRAASQQQQEQQRGATDKTLPSAEAAKPKGTQQGTWNAPNQAHDAPPHPTGDICSKRTVSRVRFVFSSAGVLEPFEWSSTVEEEAGPDSVVERDILRQDEGSVGQGYTVREMCQLARSSMPAQRTAACRHLSALLARSRPSAASSYQSLFGGGKRPSPLCVPGSEQESALDWQDVWEHALVDCQVVVVLRLALDDSSMSVMSAAAEALAQLVGPKHIDPAQACPTPSGLAAVPPRFLERPHVLGAWTAQPLETPEPPMPENAMDIDGAEQPMDERQVAAKDPLCGLLQMQVLARASYLLKLAGPGMAGSLLAILHAAALGGTDMARAICNTPGLIKAVLLVLQPALPAAAVESPGAARNGLQPSVLAAIGALGVLRALCQAGADVARDLLAQGLMSQVTRFVLGGGTMPAKARHDSDGVEALLLQIEALRIWRTCASYGRSGAWSLDDAYPALWARLSVPDWEALAAPAESPSAAHSRLVHIMASAEALMVAAEILFHAGREPDQAQVSPRCAAAILQEALAWLQPQSLQGLINFVTTAAAVDSISNTVSSTGQAALLALAAAFDIVRACTAIPDMDDAGDIKAAAHELLDSFDFRPQAAGNASLQVTPGAKNGMACKLLMLLQQCSDACQHSQGATQGHAGLTQAIAEALRAGLNASHAVSSGAARASELLTAILPLPARTPELVTMQPSDAGAFQVQQTLLGLALTGMEFTLQRPRTSHGSYRVVQQQPWGKWAAEIGDPAEARKNWLGTIDTAKEAGCVYDAAAGAIRGDKADSDSPSGGGYMQQAVLDAALRMPSLAPPGGEDLALRAMSCALHMQGIEPAIIDTSTAISKFASSDSSFAAAAALSGAWWQEGDKAVPRNALPAMPSAEEVNAVLLPAYAAHWLGLVPEQGAVPSGPCAAAAQLSAKQSLIRQPVGSRLPIPSDWMFTIEPVPPTAEQQEGSGLAHIPEEDWEDGSAQPDRPSRARVVGTGLCFLLALDNDPSLSSIQDLPLGLRLKGLMDLVFCPSNESSSEDDALWLDPLIRWTAAALLDSYGRHVSADRSPVGSITEADAARWALQFATVSYGDALFASAIALLLRPNMPKAVQVAVVEVLAQEGTLHLLPPSARAPGGREAYSSHQRPENFSKLLARLCQEGFLKKSMEHSSMVLDFLPAEAM